MGNLDVAVIVVTYNSSHVIDDLLDSLTPSLGGLTAEVVVVDNGSTDHTMDQLLSRKDCRVVRSTNVGYAGGVNRGIREASPADALLILNPDIRLLDNAARILIESLRNASIGIAVPKVIGPDGALFHSLRREPSIARSLGLSRTRLPIFAENLNRADDYDRPQVVDWALGAILAISPTCLATVGNWDESYFLYSEETDFCLRARDLGFATRYEPLAVAIHIGGQSGQDSSTYAMQVLNRVRLYRRRHGVASSATYLLLTALRELTWIHRGGRQHLGAINALLRPSVRPSQLHCSDRVLPD